MQKFASIIFIIFIIYKNKISGEKIYEEYCNVQNPGQESDCTMLNASKYTTFVPDDTTSCCFERFRINKVVTTRCKYLKKDKDGIKKEKKLLRDDWKVKNLTILCNQENIKYSYLLFGFLGILF
jgi:hypothetical protein